MPSITRTIRWLLVGLAALMLARGFSSNHWQVPVNWNGDQFSEGFVIRKMEAAKGLRPDAPGGFLILDSLAFKDYGYWAYRSSAGWQGLIPAAIARHTNLSPAAIAHHEHHLLAVLLAVVLGAFLYWLSVEIGAPAAFAAFLGMVVSAPLIYQGVNLFWMIFLAAAMPAVFWFAFAPVAEGKPYSRWALAGIAFVTFLKSGAGYEWTSTLVLDAAIPLLYYGLRSERSGAWLVKHWFIVCCASAAGFFLAVAIHTAQGWMTYGSFSEGINPIVGRAFLHISGNFDKATTIYHVTHYDPGRKLSGIEVLQHYLSMKIIGIPFTQSNPTTFTLRLVAQLGMFGSALAWLVGGVRNARMPESSVGVDRLQALAAVTVYAFFAASSWVVIAKMHSQIHDVFNIVIFTFAFVPLAAATLVAAVHYGWAERFGRNRDGETSRSRPTARARKVA